LNITGIIIIVYLFSILIAGFWKKSNNSTSDYLFAGRKLTLPAFIATLVTTWYGGILEVGRVSYEYGIATWIIFGIFYYAAGLIFLKWIAPKIHNLNIATIPEFIFSRYGKFPALLAIIMVLLIASPAPYIKMAGELYRHIFEIPELSALIICTLFSVIYAMTGGFQSVVRTDKLQFLLMFGGFALILSQLYQNFGGLDFLIKNTPEYAFSIPGNFSWTYILIWGFIAMLTFIDPGFYQRCYAGNSEVTLKRGILISIIFWVIFDMMSVLTGIYALAILPDIQGSVYLMLADHVLGPLTRGVFFVSLLAIIMSTIDSFIFISAFSIGKDLPQVLGYKITGKKLINWVRVGLVISGTTAILIAIRFTFVIDIWYTMGTFAVPVLLIPIISAMYGIQIRRPVLVMVFPLVISFLWYVYGVYNNNDGWPVYPMSLEPIYPGLLSSIALFYWFKGPKEY
jgi:solute:Na+ symporter, SSS family